MIYLLAFLILFIVFFGRSLAEKWNNYRYRKRLSALIPGDEGLPFLGNIFELGRDAESLPRTMLEKAKIVREKENGEMVKLYIMTQTTFLPFTGELLQPIIESNDEINKGEDYDVLEPWLGRGLILSGGDKWRSRRKMISPSFSVTMLAGYVEIMNSHAKVLLDVLEGKCGKEFDIYPFMKRCTLDVICDAAMGKDLDSLHNPHQPYVKAISTIMRLGIKTFMEPHLWNPVGRYISGWQKEHDESVKIAHDFTNEVIAERMDQIARGEVDVNKKAFLDMLLIERERSNLTLKDMREEVDTFMFAGHDTTSATLGWTLWCLANHPEKQERAYEEMKDIFGEDVDRDCTKDDLVRMNCLERCIKEALRIFSPVPLTMRHLGEEMQLGSYLLPRDSTLFIAPHLVHRNERIYPQPERFDPDRFLPENIAKRHPYDFIPFSAGPRNCIGQKFAMYQLKVVVSSVLRRFRLRSDRDFNSVTQMAEVVLKSRDGINVTIERR